MGTECFCRAVIRNKNLTNASPLTFSFIIIIKSSGKIDEFDKLRTLGTGSFGRVMLMLHKPTKTYYAVKILDKQKVICNKCGYHSELYL